MKIYITNYLQFKGEKGMKKREYKDLLRFYGSDVREKSGGVMIYGEYSRDKLWGDENAYRTLNALLFDGYENEKERIQKENRQLNPVFIERLEDTLEIYTGIFSLMCENRNVDSSIKSVKRVDRLASLNAYTQGKTGSFVSCTKGDYQEEFSDKNQVILLEIEASLQSPYIDIQQLVSEKEYSNYSEQEVLFPPFLPLCTEQGILTKRETKMIKDMYGNPPVGKYILKMGNFPNYKEEITASKDILYKKLVKGKSAAAASLEKMNKGYWEEKYKDYVEWKENLHTYLKLVYSDMWYGEKIYGE